jgi:hypothetical protein
VPPIARRAARAMSQDNIQIVRRGTEQLNRDFTCNFTCK